MDRAGEHLRIAWSEAYGRTPDSGKAYLEAVRAVEAAAAPVVIPRDPLPTLGKILTALSDRPEKWVVTLGGSSQQPVDTRAVMDMLWRSQFDRHGTADENVPMNVSDAEAEAAVHLAALLVHWFKTGAVRQVD